MQKPLLTLIFLFLLQLANAQLTILVNSIPSNTPVNDDIYIAGNFQAWDAGDPAYILTDNMNGSFQITVNPPVGTVEYKFTRGSWATVEGNATGGFLPNRTFSYNGTATTIQVDILTWEDLGGGNGTAAANVSIIDNNFFIPQLNRNRRIWLYLPPDYDTSQKDYPVLYMHDGQNVFDVTTSFSGEWEVDESLNDLFNQGDYGCIVVAIDNGEAFRIDEYSPWVNPTYGGGEGDEYMDFIVNTLKPFIDNAYRTLPGREYTGLMGSSLGGLITQYGGIQFQNTFSKLGLFSPSYWFSDECYTHVATNGHQAPFRIYTIAGTQEGSSMVNGVNNMETTFLNNGFSSAELNTTIHPDGQHSEWYWAREFPDAYEWLFGDLLATSILEPEADPIDIFPVPAVQSVRIKGFEMLNDPSFQIFAMDGRVVASGTLSEDEIDITQIPPGIFVLQIRDFSGALWTKKLVIISQ